MVPCVPGAYGDFREGFPEIARAYHDLAVRCYEQGPLDETVRRPVRPGIGIGLNPESAVRSHARRAPDEGAAADELRHALLPGLTTSGFPSMIAAMKWVQTAIRTHRRSGG